MTKIFGVMVVKNEESRYLESMLKHSSKFWDDVFIMDDVSSDNTVEIASSFGHVEVRPSHVSSFTQNESEFREFCWTQFEKIFKPSSKDWILILDADEFIISEQEYFIELANSEPHTSWNIRIPELWSLVPPLIRVDGFWNKNSSPRFFKYRENGIFSGKKMGCPPYPTFVKPTATAEEFEILHVGYANEEDAKVKHERYSRISEGHSSSHIKSIVSEPSLVQYCKDLPLIYRGPRWT